MQESAQLPGMTTIAADIDPAVENVIRRCLDPDPAQAARRRALDRRRPSWRRSPGRRARRRRNTVARKWSPPPVKRKASRASGPFPASLVLAACLFTVPWLQYRDNAFLRAPLEDPPDVLAHQAREIAHRSAIRPHPADSAVWLDHRRSLVHYLNQLPKPRNWSGWLAAEAPIRGVYRQSPRPSALCRPGSVEADNPPMTTPGMVERFHGRLRQAALL